jgi:hypothetical protein
MLILRQALSSRFNNWNENNAEITSRKSHYHRDIMKRRRPELLWSKRSMVVHCNSNAMIEQEKKQASKRFQQYKAILTKERKAEQERGEGMVAPMLLSKASKASSTGSTTQVQHPLEVILHAPQIPRRRLSIWRPCILTMAPCMGWGEIRTCRTTRAWHDTRDTRLLAMGLCNLRIEKVKGSGLGDLRLSIVI